MLAEQLAQGRGRRLRVAAVDLEPQRIQLRQQLPKILEPMEGASTHLAPAVEAHAVDRPVAVVAQEQQVAHRRGRLQQRVGIRPAHAHEVAQPVAEQGERGRVELARRRTRPQPVQAAPGHEVREARVADQLGAAIRAHHPVGLRLAACARGFMCEPEMVVGQGAAQAAVQPRHLAGPVHRVGRELRFEQLQVAVGGEARGHGVGPLPQQRVPGVELARDLGVLAQQHVDAWRGRRVVRVPTPALAQPGGFRALPGRGAGRLGLAQHAHPGEVQPRLVAPPQQVLLDALVHQQVGVEARQIGGRVVHQALELQRQRLALVQRVGLQQQQLQQRLVRRLDRLVQVPEGRAEELVLGDAGNAAEVEVGGRRQRRREFVVAPLVVGRDQPPQRCRAAQQHGGAIELVEQQPVLGGAAVVAGERRAVAGPQLHRVHQEGAQVQPVVLAPVGLALQPLVEPRVVGAVAAHHPEVEVAVEALAEGAGAAHQVHAEHVLAGGVQQAVGQGIECLARAHVEHGPQALDPLIIERPEALFRLRRRESHATSIGRGFGPTRAVCTPTGRRALRVVVTRPACCPPRHA